MSSTTESLAGPYRLRLRWLTLVFLGLALLVAVGIRVRLLDFPLERDEGEYAYAGQLLLEGVPPYLTACDMKMPGIYLAYAAAMSVFGQTPAGIHSGLIVVNLATLAVLFLIARKFLDFPGAAAATAVYALMSLSPACLGLAAHATHFVMLAALLGVWMLLRMEKNGRLAECFAAGCFFGVAFLMKQPGVFFGFFGGLYLGWFSLAGKISVPRVLVRLGLYSAGCLLPFFAACLWLKMAGAFHQFWFWTLDYPRQYAEIVPFSDGIINLETTFTNIFNAAPLLWAAAGLGLACLCCTRMELNARVFLAGYLVFSFLATCPGLYFRRHYFIVLLPAVALLAGLAVSWGGRRLAAKNAASWLNTAPWVLYMPVTLAALACAQSLLANEEVFFHASPREACREVYGENPFPEALDIASYIEQHTGKDQRIVVIGSEPEIYFYSHRRSCTSQTSVYPLMEPKPYARKLQEDMIRDIEQNPPAYLVFVSIHVSWEGSPASVHLLPDWVHDYVENKMRRVGLIQFTGLENPEAVWGPDAADTVPQSNLFISVYKWPDRA